MKTKILLFLGLLVCVLDTFSANANYRFRTMSPEGGFMNFIVLMAITIKNIIHILQSCNRLRNGFSRIWHPIRRVVCM